MILINAKTLFIIEEKSKSAHIFPLLLMTVFLIVINISKSRFLFMIKPKLKVVFRIPIFIFLSF